MRWVYFLLSVSLLLLYTTAYSLGYSQEKGAIQEWWELRQERQDAHFPHNAHREILKEEGDSCLLCHLFSKTDVKEEKKVHALTLIANEPLKAVCHSCHVEQQRGPWRCALCHTDKTKIWPDSHRFGYVDHHGEDARRDENVCQTCHLDLQFCTDCHFRRDTMGTGYHPLGYRTLHGIESRLTTLSCGRCHQSTFCDDCHRISR